ncbi:hypothetical protein [Corynebacterium terpenotabidum]|uniref:Uncharacterized protein n=1 Tax=Corynebacterium terpenotabidum Y-11 TaxID=1200352 RepID=S4XBX9_9CORY|nr:hypothetical protein [Corynebacterium terpenotabidum]AGP30096.1 hypothetical protein A606_02215 [Corynebacterium terpenotabidum Y-11]
MDINDYEERLSASSYARAEFDDLQQQRMEGVLNQAADLIATAIIRAGQSTTTAVESLASSQRAIAESMDALRRSVEELPGAMKKPVREVAAQVGALTEHVGAMTTKVEELYTDSKAFPVEEYTQKVMGDGWDGTLHHHEVTGAPLKEEEYRK